jgi:hypothetical protein
MARIECYISDELKEKIALLAKEKHLSTSKYISHILESHFDDEENPVIFQKKVMATLCDIYSCVFDEDTEEVNREAVLSRMVDIKKQCDLVGNA